MNHNFTCFEPAFFDFFRDLTQNNNKEWFDLNKARFKQTVQTPLIALVETVAPDLMQISPYLVADPKLNGGSIFRIYRDTRFSNDKTPYKTHAAVQFRHQQYKNVHTPGFYLHLGIDKVIYGGGIWMPEPASLQKIRERIRDKPSVWASVVENKRLLDIHGGIEGDGLTRPPKGFSSEQPYMDDIKRKSYFAMTEIPASDALNRNFLEKVIAGFYAASPLVAFLCAALDVQF